MAYNNRGTITGGSALGSNAKAEAATPPVTVSGHIIAMSSEIEQLETVLGRLRNISDRVNGPRPREVNAAANPNVATEQAPGFADQLNSRRAHIRYVADEIHAEIDAIERGL